MIEKSNMPGPTGPAPMRVGFPVISPSLVVRISTVFGSIAWLSVVVDEPESNIVGSISLSLQLPMFFMLDTY